MNKVQIIFPHQLFQDVSHLNKHYPIYLIEEHLFFNQYKFHKRKIAFHRASMQFYKDFLIDNDFEVIYINAKESTSDIRKLISDLAKKGISEVYIMNPTDNWLEKRIQHSANEHAIKVHWVENKLFLNTKEDLTKFFSPTKKKFFQTSFYKNQRIKRNILVTNQQPIGKKWTYDTENRKKYPTGKKPPSILFPKETKYHKEALNYTNLNYKDNYGAITIATIYPIDFKGAKQWFQQFLEQRFYEFGDYEDAIVQEQSILNHSLLSPLMNVGLLTPEYVVKESLNYAVKNEVPINSLEGFIRQIIGWREFIRGVYEVKGTEERTRNYWNHTRKIPKSFYEATTGILPVDKTIQKTLKTGYAHHIERLMILGNMMVLCEFNPDDVYQWFMELYIDAYDWVMVPNVYGMSLFADGGLMSTKPYISSSNYILKMSDYPKGDWQKTWDGLFWRFMAKHKDFFLSNPRLSMLVKNLEKMSPEKKAKHLANAEKFLQKLDAE